MVEWIVSPIAITNETGVVKEGYEYTPYGKPITYTPGSNEVMEWGAGDDGTLTGGSSPLGNRVFYTGRSWDPGTGLHYYRTRYYDPDMGRFISSDTIGIWGDSGNFGNGYTYVANRPMDVIDPSGQCPWCLVGLAVLALAALSSDPQRPDEKPQQQMFSFKVPRSDWGPIYIEYFIMAPEVLGQRGDNRGFNPARETDKSRVSIMVHPAQEKGEVVVNYSCQTGGACWSAGSEKENEFSAKMEGNRLELKGNFYTSAYSDPFIPGIDVDLGFVFEEHDVSIRGAWDGFPSMEISYDGRNLLERQEGNPLKVIG